MPIKYDTTAVISEEYSNFEDPFTQMYTNSILSGGKIERNIEEMHYIQVNLFKSIQNMLDRAENNSKDNAPKPKDYVPQKAMHDGNMLEV